MKLNAMHQGVTISGRVLCGILQDEGDCRRIPLLDAASHIMEKTCIQEVLHAKECFLSLQLGTVHASRSVHAYLAHWPAGEWIT